MSLKSLGVSFVAVTLLGVGVNLSQAKGQDSKPGKDFAPVSKIFQDKCVSCHNDKRHPAKVDLSTYDSVMKSGGDNLVVVPKHPEKSNLLAYVDGSKKPQMPMNGKALSSDDVGAIKKWIKDGAKN